MLYTDSHTDDLPINARQIAAAQVDRPITDARQGRRLAIAAMMRTTEAAPSIMPEQKRWPRHVRGTGSVFRGLL